MACVDLDSEHLLTSWFNRGFLVLRRIEWSTPAVILEKIIRYEAVHEIKGWDDLRRRIDPPDRRLYAFFHPALVDEPLIFVEVALTMEMPDAIAPILADGREVLVDAERVLTAVFYSISNCQPGLKGISFGNFLIKQVVEELARSFPSLKTFATLSPVPGFRRWIGRELDADIPEAVTESDRAVLGLLEIPGWCADPLIRDQARPILEALAAHYFLRARAVHGAPCDPVARFHLGNGARLERLDPFGDLSERALDNAYGLMVNYVYDRRQIERNHEAYANEGTIAVAPTVRRLLRRGCEARQLATTGR